MSAKVRAIMVIVASVSLAVLLTSCTASAHRGRTIEQASDAAAAVPGVADASVKMRNYRSGFTSDWGSTVYFTPSSGFEDVNKSRLLRDLLRVGWSVNEHKLDNGVALSVGRDSDLDLISLARQADLPRFASNPQLPYQITFSKSEMQRLFGEWPGD